MLTQLYRMIVSQRHYYLGDNFISNTVRHASTQYVAATIKGAASIGSSIASLPRKLPTYVHKACNCQDVNSTTPLFLRTGVWGLKSSDQALHAATVHLYNGNCSFSVSVRLPPSINAELPKPVTYRQNGVLSFDCTAVGTPSPRWYKLISKWGSWNLVLVSKLVFIWSQILDSS